MRTLRLSSGTDDIQRPRECMIYGLKTLVDTPLVNISILLSFWRCIQNILIWRLIYKVEALHPDLLLQHLKYIANLQPGLILIDNADKIKFIVAVSLSLSFRVSCINHRQSTSLWFLPYLSRLISWLILIMLPKKYDKQNNVFISKFKTHTRNKYLWWNDACCFTYCLYVKQ